MRVVGVRTSFHEFPSLSRTRNQGAMRERQGNTMAHHGLWHEIHGIDMGMSMGMGMGMGGVAL